MNRNLFSIGLACIIILFMITDFAPAQGSRPMVRIIHFIPSDRVAQVNIDPKLDRLIKNIQSGYADEMERHGFGRKTFNIETNTNGKTVVHHVKGEEPTSHYYNGAFGKIRDEIHKRFDTSKNFYYVLPEFSSKVLGERIAGIGSAFGARGGMVITHQYATDEIPLTAHELGHTFGLKHDFRDGHDIMHQGWRAEGILGNPIILMSKCAAEWLDVHPAFNLNQPIFNQPGTINMLSPTLASPPNVIRLRFEISDPDGLHQAQLFRNEQRVGTSLIDCRSLNGDRSSTVDFVTNQLMPTGKTVMLAVIDRHGNSMFRNFPIDMPQLLSAPKVIPMPDPNLAATIQAQVGNSITTHTILNLVNLYPRNRQITDLSGLEHAYNLRNIDLVRYGDGNVISDLSPIAELTQLHRLNLGYVQSINDVSLLTKLTRLTYLGLEKTFISDIAPLTALTQLVYLNLRSTNVSDISALTKLTQLRFLDLSSLTISDISPLTEMTQLKFLSLSYNNISDISPLAGLTLLSRLHLVTNDITDLSPLAGLTQLRTLYLPDNNITDLSALAGLTQLRTLHLYNNNITDMSPLAGLTWLRTLYLWGNNISDVTPLTGLTQLDNIALWGNNISDVTPLAELTQLRELSLGDNISDVTPLAELSQLTSLYLWNNNISNVTPLAELSQLKNLHLGNNNISDVSPLVRLDLVGTQSDAVGLSLQGNPLSYTSINTHIPAMRAKGINVLFDDVAHPALYIISGDEQEGFAGKLLSSPLVVEAQDEKGEPMPNLSVTFTVIAGDRQISNTTTVTDSNGIAKTVPKLGWTQGTHTVRVTAKAVKSRVTFTATVITSETLIPEDVNRDGIVDVEDLVLVAASLGATPPEGAIIPKTDINEDGVVNHKDMELVLAILDSAPAAPATDAQPVYLWTAANLQRWIDKARQIAIKDETFLRGIAVLEKLLASLTPKETALLPNYPNPFNPETWIPYHLAEPAEVIVNIYSINGKLIRTLALGLQSAGIYEHRGRAVYWDGRNEQGEHVASGIYFYTLTAGDFTSTRKMLIRK